jgi:hypothetical protein
MATRWSRLHGELYLRRKRTFSEVEDVEGLETVLWLRGIGQWCSGSGDLLGGGHRLPCHRARVEEEDREGNDERERE